MRQVYNKSVFFRLGFLGSVLFWGCESNNESEIEELYEGENPNDCSDNADNDRDGYFDCDDSGCWGSAACDSNESSPSNSQGEQTSEPEATQEPESGGTEPSGTNIVEHYRSFTLEYSLSWDFDGSALGGDAVLEQMGIFDCVSSFVASGTQTQAQQESVTFFGDWTLTNSDCGVDLQSPDVIWYDVVSGKSFSTFHFEDALRLEAWVQHEVENDFYAESSNDGKWYIFGMTGLVDDSSLTFSYEELENTVVEGMIPLELKHNVTIQFFE